MVCTIQIEKEIVMSKFLKKIVWLIIIAPAIYLAIVWNKLPDRVATHFDLHGDPDKFGNKNELWLLTGIIAVVSTLVYLLISYAYRFDPKKHASENKDRLMRIAFTVVLFMTVVSATIIHSAISTGIKFNMRFIFAAIGFLLAIVGNYMHNIKPNYFAGLRLPWTLENEENWRKTHLVGGKIWFAGGILIGIICLFSSFIIAVISTFVLFLVMIFVPIVYSYRLYKKQKSLNSTT
jgi:uncharacterized membrane protein